MTKRATNYPFMAFEAAMIVIALFFIFPAVLIVMNSLKTDSQINLNPVSLPTSVTFENYVQIWQMSHFPQVLLNTLIITVFSTAGVILISAMAAYILARTESKISWLLFLFFAFSMIIPFQTVMVPLVRLSTDFHLNNIFGIIPMYMGLGCPMAIFLYHGFTRSIPLGLEESASIDGAGIFQTFFKIVFPLLTPITATIVILDVLWIWNDFLLPLIIIKKGTLQLTQFSFIGTFRQEWGRATAGVVLSATPVVVFYLALQKYIVKGIAAGAIKG